MTILKDLLHMLLPYQTQHVIIAVCLIAGLFLVIKYRNENAKYSEKQQEKAADRLPPQFPSLLPYIGSVFSLVWNTKDFLRQATSFAGELSASKIAFFGLDIYLFQDRETVKRIFKQQSLSSPISLYIYVLKYLFGLPESALAIYRADDSGPLPKPYRHSDVQPQDRIDHITHHPYSRALSGPGLRPTTRRFIQSLYTRIEAMNWGNEWTQEENIEVLFHRGPAVSLIEAIFGPTLLQLNPGFVEDMWKFDNFVPWFSRAIPSFLMPEPYRLRRRLRSQLKNWYRHARQHFQESCISEDGDGDPFWGSELVRHRQKVLLRVDKHDDDVLASTDIGLAWGAMGNTIPVAMLATIHIFQDANLLRRVRSLVETCLGQRSLLDLDPQELVQIPLLSSIYTEILRLYVNTYCMLSSPHLDVPLGKWRLPKGQVCLLNSNISQMDRSFWNTQDGLHPVAEFWSDRFIIDPANPLSGPITPVAREDYPRGDQDEKKEPYFSKKGTEGSFFPYGGGHSICPGRLLAKRTVLLTCALLVHGFDIEFQDDAIKLDQFRFGLGVGQLQQAIRFRVRKRKVV